MGGGYRGGEGFVIGEDLLVGWAVAIVAIVVGCVLLCLIVGHCR